MTGPFLFGVSNPLAKLLVRDINILMLAGLLYLGSGFGLAIVRENEIDVSKWDG